MPNWREGAKRPRGRIETIYDPREEGRGAGIMGAIGILALIAVKLLIDRGIM